METNLQSECQIKTNQVEVSFVLPCLNEARTVGACVRDCLGVIRSSNVVGEVVVADNGSTDGSQKLAESAGARVIHVQRRGYGSALLAGIRSAEGKYVVMGDSDMSYDFTQVPRFIEKLRQGNDLVMGCRMSRGGGTILPGAMPLLHHWLGNPVLSILGRILFATDIIDFQCGIRGFSRERALELGLCTPGMEFASEMIVKASLAKWKIAQVPVTLRQDGRNRPPHLRTWRDGWRHLRFMLLHAPRWLFLLPGLSVMLLSACSYAALIWAPVTFHGIRFDTKTLLIAAAGILVGFQVTLMGLFSELFCQTTGLLPSRNLGDAVLKSGPFEKGLLFGGMLFLGGALCLVLGFLNWKKTGFGDLDSPNTLRLIISSVTGMSLGVQAVFGGFVLAVLGIKSDSE
ncbi:MAG TPA: glycosyltransferase family 2 protein [Verrucomicrobiae bacterium]|jgi:glycosyltransferase involved in cell wall biosynthesis